MFAVDLQYPGDSSFEFRYVVTYARLPELPEIRIEDRKILAKLGGIDTRLTLHFCGRDGIYSGLFQIDEEAQVSCQAFQGRHGDTPVTVRVHIRHLIALIAPYR